MMDRYIRIMLNGLILWSVFASSSMADESNPSSAQSYLLKANDVVRLAVFDETDLSTQTRILQTGEAVFPLVGAVRIGGLTIRDATSKVRDLYAADYLVDPKVTLTVDDYAQQLVSVLGAVGSPGQFPIPQSGRLDVASAIASAGGLGPTADAERISVVRADGTTSVFALASLERGRRVQLGVGDRVIVGESRFLNQSVTLVGEVKSKGLVSFPLDGKLDVVAAIARAGGFTDLANPRKVTVNRGGNVMLLDVREMSEKGAKPFRLEPNDIICVPERLF